MNKKQFITARVFFLSLFFISISVHCFAYEQVVYVWQRNWNSNVGDAVISISNSTGYFTVLCGDLRFKEEKPFINSINIKWDYLTQTETSTTVAFRISTQASKFLATSAIESLANSVGDSISKTIKSAPKNEIVGIQIDYDCPTSKLVDYVKLIKLLKRRFQHFQISFTALPSWLDSKDFPALAATSDYYVLQVHSFKTPATLEEALRPFSGEAVSSWIKKASLIGHPFYVSLPTYGYEVSFNESGKFLGLRAETQRITYKPGTKHALVMTDYKRIMAFLTEIEKQKPKHLMGFCWFRLPLKTDEFNWSIETLEMIIEHKIPQVSLKSEVISPKPGLYEVYLVNDGQVNIFKDIQFKLTWNKDITFIYDVLAGYREEGLGGEGGIKITGIPPKTGNKILVAWFRTERKDINPLRIGEVEGYEK